MNNPNRLRDFVQDFTRLVDSGPDEARIFRDGRALLAALVAVDDWLAPAFAQPHPDHYQQYLLHRDPRERFSVVSFVWGPGQSTPLHDHTVWGMVGMLRGGETSEAFSVDPRGGMLAGPVRRLFPGDVDLVSPRIGDIHRVANACDGKVSVSIHVYGADMAKVARHVYDGASGAARPFTSGYANAQPPDAQA